MSTVAPARSKRGGVRLKAEAVTATPAAGFRLIPVGEITPGPYQLRKNFDEAALAELSASIGAKGVLEPVLVRFVKGTPYGFSIAPANNAAQLWGVLPGEDPQAPVFHIVGRDAAEDLAKALARDHYELVAGERRWRAARLAGLKEIPAIVRELSDRDAAEVGVIENLQRRDLDPIEEAEGYQLLISKHGYTADALAEKLSKSKSYVYGALKLNGLPERARKALAAGELSTSVAQLIGRIPSEKLREQAAYTILGDASYRNYRNAKDEIERRYMRELKGAPFDQADDKLLPGAGSCAACPNRTGNNRVEYPEGRADICTEPSCFEKKVNAFHDRALDEYREKGHEVLSREEGKKMFPYSDGYISGNTKYVTLSQTCYEDPKNRTVSAILGRSYKPAIVQTPRGTVVKLALKADVAKALKEQGVQKGTALTSRPTPSRAAERGKPEPGGEDLDDRVDAVVCARLTEAAETGKAEVRLELMRYIALDALSMTCESDEIATRRGIEFKAGKSEQALREAVAGMGYTQLVGLYLEIHFREWGSSSAFAGSQGGEFATLLPLYGVDAKAVEREVKEQAKAERKAQPAAEAKGKKAAPGK